MSYRSFAHFWLIFLIFTVFTIGNMQMAMPGIRTAREPCQMNWSHLERINISHSFFAFLPKLYRYILSIKSYFCWNFKFHIIHVAVRRLTVLSFSVNDWKFMAVLIQTVLVYISLSIPPRNNVSMSFTGILVKTKLVLTRRHGKMSNSQRLELVLQISS